MYIEFLPSKGLFSFQFIPKILFLYNDTSEKFMMEIGMKNTNNDFHVLHLC